MNKSITTIGIEKTINLAVALFISFSPEYQFVHGIEPVWNPNKYSPCQYEAGDKKVTVARVSHAGIGVIFL